EINFEDAIHSGEGNHQSALPRYRAARESGAGAAPDEWHTELARKLHKGDNVGSTAGERDEIRGSFIDAPIVLVEAEVGGLVEVPARPEQRAHLLDEVGGNHPVSV